MRDLVGKVAVITGGASGIGLALAHACIEAGMQVVIADIVELVLAEVCAALPAIGVRTDVSDPESVAALASSVKSEFGTCHLVFNNAGVGGLGQIVDQSLADWNWIIDVNLRGVIHVIHSFLPMLLSNPGGGHLVNTASIAGLVPFVSGPYTAAKYAVVGISETLRHELAGTKVGVSVLCPGFVHTNIRTSHRNRPGDVGEAASARVRSTTTSPLKGQTLTVLEPADVARQTMHAVTNNEFWIVTDPSLLRLSTRYDELREIAEGPSLPRGRSDG